MDWTLTALFLTTLIPGFVLILGYIRISTHISHPCQIVPSLKLYLAQKRLQLPPNCDENWSWNYTKLKEISQSFAYVILRAPPPFREAVSIFYLAARALDSIENDMQRRNADKERELRAFYKHLADPTFTLKGFGETRVEVEILEQFGQIATAFVTLSFPVQATIRGVIQKMGDGMASGLNREITSIPDLDEYCHHVAGIVGIGVVQIGIDLQLQCEYPGVSVIDREEMNNNAGLFLQKVNIIRDFSEDLRVLPRPRVFWPTEIWSKYTDRLENFLEPEFRRKAVTCANELVGNAASHLSGVLRGLSYLDQGMLQAIAAPFVMSMATLELCYDNDALFRSSLKIRRGEAAYIFEKCDKLQGVLSLFRYYAERMQKKARNVFNLEAIRLIEVLDKAMKLGEELIQKQ